MSAEFEIKNRVAESGLVNFDLADLVPKGERLGVDLKDFLWEGQILREKDFREKIGALNPETYQDKFIFIYNSAEAIVPLWSYFLLAAALAPVAKRVVHGNRDFLETLLLHEAVEAFDAETLRGKRVLIRGCTEVFIPENAYVEFVAKVQPVVKSLMFGEACSNVPIFKN